MRTGADWHRMAIALGAVAVVIASGTGLVLSVTSAPRSSISLTLTIEFNPSDWYVSISPNSFQAAGHSLVQFSIVKYDPTTHLVAANFCNVTGTVGDIMHETLQGTSSTGQATVFWVAPQSISHTFTMESNGYTINVPIPAASPSGAPSVVTFSFETLTTGVSTWASEASINGPHGTTGTVGGFFSTT
jgi:hypothetical protein